MKIIGGEVFIVALPTRREHNWTERRSLGSGQRSRLSPNHPPSSTSPGNSAPTL